MKFFIFLLLTAGIGCAQKSTSVGNTGAPTSDTAEARRILGYLASDEMKGRRTGSPEIDRAADFLAAEMKSAGLQPFRSTSCLQKFSTVRPKFIAQKVEIDDRELDPKSAMVITTQAELKVNEKSGYAVQRFTTTSIKNDQAFFGQAGAVWASKKNTVVFVDTAFTKNFGRLGFLKRQLFRADHSVVFVLGLYEPKEFTIKAEHQITETPMQNVVGYLPGTEKPDEYVLFSAHYDHIGTGKAVDGDSIFNGANDDAAGTTAVLLLARHFVKQKGNKRSLLFVAFTAEEVGGFGSQYFGESVDPATIVAGLNIEMIGTESKWGRGSAYITGYEKSSLGSILQASLKGSPFRFYPDPYPEQDLFYRSDNATLARLGVPAHTLSTSKMDSEPNYHKVTDEVRTLDIANMVEIVRAVATSAASIIDGKATPTRVKTSELR